MRPFFASASHCTIFHHPPFPQLVCSSRHRSAAGSLAARPCHCKGCGTGWGDDRYIPHNVVIIITFFPLRNAAAGLRKIHRFPGTRKNAELGIAAIFFCALLAVSLFFSSFFFPFFVPKIMVTGQLENRKMGTKGCLYQNYCVV